MFTTVRAPAGNARIMGREVSRGRPAKLANSRALFKGSKRTMASKASMQGKSHAVAGVPQSKGVGTATKTSTSWLERGKRYFADVPLNWDVGSKENLAAEAAKMSKKRSDEYHRNSTLFAHCDRATLERLDADFSYAPHRVPVTKTDKIAWNAIRFLRWASDLYFKDRYVQRACMLETVAAIPGIVAGKYHHLRSLRHLKNDNWIKTLLDEAENERMHLMVYMTIYQPTTGQRILLFAVQLIFYVAYSAVYVLFPRLAHRFTGYLEEEAVKTYTSFLAAIDSGAIENVPAPQIAIDYWDMPADADLRDVVLVTRADECTHRDVQHIMSDRLRTFGNDYSGPLNIKLEDIADLPPRVIDTQKEKPATS